MIYLDEHSPFVEAKKTLIVLNIGLDSLEDSNFSGTEIKELEEEILVAEEAVITTRAEAERQRALVNPA